MAAPKDEPEAVDMDGDCMKNYFTEIAGKRFFVTGATGLIGQNLVRYLRDNGASVLALTRRPVDGLDYVLGNVENLPEIPGEIDYIIHGASATASAYFVEHPVETIETAVVGTRNLLELAKDKHVKGFVYLSSMEVYGHPPKGHKVTEDEVAGFDPTNPRNCYPISKVMCESLCCSYAKEYAVPAKIVRLTQTFGPGVAYDDKRVFAEFMRCAIQKKDITLRTRGETERSYLYTDDATQAILTVLLKGNIGEAYTVANPDTYCSIAKFAQMVSQEYGIDVRFELEDIRKYGYAGTLYMDLDVSKLEALGWKAETGLLDAVANSVKEIKEGNMHG